MAEPVFVESREGMERILPEEVLGYLGLTGSGLRHSRKIRGHIRG